MISDFLLEEDGNWGPPVADLSALSAGGRFLPSSSADDLEAMMLAGLRAGVVRRA